MGQTKKLLDFIFEDELNIFPDDCDMSYEEWVEQKELQQSAYEEMLGDSK
jgi:hypothetical protein